METQGGRCASAIYRTAVRYQYQPQSSTCSISGVLRSREPRPDAKLCTWGRGRRVQAWDQRASGSFVLAISRSSHNYSCKPSVRWQVWSVFRPVHTETDALPDTIQKFCINTHGFTAPCIIPEPTRHRASHSHGGSCFEFYV